MKIIFFIIGLCEKIFREKIDYLGKKISQDKLMKIKNNYEGFVIYCNRFNVF